jgi:hypothetical protein
MKLFSKSTAEPPPDDAALVPSPAKPFAVIVAEVLKERLPRAPFPDLRLALETVGPDILSSLDILSRLLLLEAIELLPIAEFLQRIENAATPARAACDKLETIAEDLASLTAQAEAMAASGDFDPAAFAALRGKIEALQNRRADATPLRMATDKLVAVLDEVGAQVHQLTRFQNGRSPRIGAWFGLASHPMNGPKCITDPVTRAKKILAIADSASAELARLERGELPEPYKSKRESVSILNLQFWI